MQPLPIYSTKKFKFIAVIALCSFWMVHGVPGIINREVNTISKCKTSSSEPFAIDLLTQEWEHEHQKLYQEEADEKGLLEWKSLENKNLNEYCRKYLHKYDPERTTHDTTGFQQLAQLHYQKQNKIQPTFLQIVYCITQIGDLHFYIARAPELNCVYALNRFIGSPSKIHVYIINKLCDFEQCGYNTHVKRKIKRTDGDGKIHKNTGQPIANNELLGQHELNHEKLCQKRNGHIDWMYIKIHNNLNEYCSKYLQKCIPTRHFNGVSGNLKTYILMYHKANFGKLKSAIVLQCTISYGGNNRYYYLTRAFEPNCVYALLRSGGKTEAHPFRIIYKHCDFEPTNVKLETPEASDISYRNIYPFKRIKIEDSTAVETLQLFPYT